MERKPDFELAVDGRVTRAYLAAPVGDGSRVGVVVLQEWWGLNDNIRDTADRLARAGFYALAPDLYYGETATEPEHAQRLASALQYPDALEIVQSAIDYLLALDEIAPKRVGVIGFCMGGGLAWHGGARLKGIGALVPCYGGCPELAVEDVAKFEAPVLGIYGELDQGVTPAVAQRRAETMDAAGIRHQTIIYPDAQHAFMNDSRPNYQPEAAEDAFQRILDFFREELR